MLRLHRLSATVALGVVLSGCTTVRATATSDADLRQFRTFAWYQPTTPTWRQREFDQSAAGQLVRARIARALARRGIHETTPEHADFVVSAHTHRDDRITVNDWGYPTVFWGTPPGPVTVDQYTTGTLIVEFTESSSGRVLWRGVATAVIDRPDNPNMYKLAAAVDKMLRHYPSRVASLAPRPRL